MLRKYEEVNELIYLIRTFGKSYYYLFTDLYKHIIINYYTKKSVNNIVELYPMLLVSVSRDDNYLKTDLDILLTATQKHPEYIVFASQKILEIINSRYITDIDKLDKSDYDKEKYKKLYRRCHHYLVYNKTNDSYEAYPITII
jgi:hypothetical protein